MTFYEELQWRGLIKDVSSSELEEKLNQGGLTFYIGADPTARSLHIGQLPTFLMIERLKRAGHHPIVLVGGATGRVGDPRGTGERDKMDIDVIETNFQCIKRQMQKLFGEEVKIVDNYEWFQDIHYIDFLRDIGKCINVNYMINKDLVKRQMEVGISYAEFSYMLIQGYDYKCLHDRYGVTLQFGGSDQWGNLTTGIELIRKLNNEEVYAFSIPLTTDSQGVKLGKSYGNALWLDKEMTSSYELYQYLLNFEDSMIEDYLKRYTFLSKEEIDEVMKHHQDKPEERKAQKVLAKEVITFLHGEEAYLDAVRISEALFCGDIKNLSSLEIEDAFHELTPYELKDDCNIVDLLVDACICSSKRESREFLTNGSIRVNGEKVTDLDFQVTKDVAIDQKYVIIRRGKKKYFMIQF